MFTDNNANIIDTVRNSDNIMTSENNVELARRIEELSDEFMIRNKDLYKRLETR